VASYQIGFHQIINFFPKEDSRALALSKVDFLSKRKFGAPSSFMSWFDVDDWYGFTDFEFSCFLTPLKTSIYAGRSKSSSKLFNLEEFPISLKT
jgi:hypothetical protein